jgi:hypothetical protein
MAKFALATRAVGEHTDITGLPLYPLIFLLAICFLLLTLVFMTKLNSVSDKREG